MIDTTNPTFEEVPQNAVILSAEDFPEFVDDTSEEVDETEEQEEESQEEESAEETVVAEDPLAQTVYDTLVEKGLFDEDKDFKPTFEGIEEKLADLPNKLLRQAIDDLPQHSQQILKYIATAGQNLEKQELDQFIREFINEQVVPDVSSLDQAREYLEQHLKSTGLKDRAIQAQLDDLEESDELITEAEKLLKSKNKTTDRLIEDKAKENAEIAESTKQFYQSVNSTLAELKWSKEKQASIIATMPKTNQIFQEVLQNPKAYVQLMDFISTYKSTTKEFDLEPYRKQGEGRATSNIRQKLEKSGFTSSSSKTSTSSETPAKGSLEEILKTYKPVV